MNTASILYIEDEKFFGDILLKKLSEEGMAVSLALTGQMGLDLATKQKFDLILLDLMLPGMNGFEVLEKLKANPETKHIPVIVLSNLDTQYDKSKAERLGVEAFMVKMLSKPFDVHASIERVLNKHKTS